MPNVDSDLSDCHVKDVNASRWQEDSFSMDGRGPEGGWQMREHDTF
ncbi:MAG: hypothetical protein QXX87_03400 [Candidatus Jordarchaeales archaeon]